MCYGCGPFPGLPTGGELMIPEMKGKQGGGKKKVPMLLLAFLWHVSLENVLLWCPKGRPGDYLNSDPTCLWVVKWKQKEGLSACPLLPRASFLYPFFVVGGVGYLVPIPLLHNKR
jgi:hypothetical protein